jgi:glucoamylase
VQGFADSLGSASKVWYTLGNGELENVFYPQTDTPATFGLHYIVTDGSTFTDTETANTSHAISLPDSTSLAWQQANTAANGKYKITKTYVAECQKRSVSSASCLDVGR